MSALVPDADARDLAVLRVAIALVIATSGSVAVAPEWAALPAEARVAPLGVGFLVPHLPITPTVARVVRAVLYAACVTGGLGLFSRASFVVITACAAYVLLVPQLGGAVFHDHHLLWLAALLAASPCGDALSLDAWRARRRGRARPTCGPAYGLALRAAWLVLGLVFFFPGVHKLLSPAFALGDALRDQLRWKWALDPSLVPALRIDRVPWLMRALAWLTIAFELGFVALVFARPTRVLAVCAALVFHLATHVLMGIDFPVLYACYVVFVPWAALHDRLRPAPTPTRGTGGVRTVVIVASLLVAGIAWAGARGAMQAYPFACYPTFADAPSPYVPALVIEVERADGSRDVLPRDLYLERGARGTALEWRLVGAYGDLSTARLRAWWDDVARRAPLASRLRDARAIRFVRVSRGIDPDHPGEARGARTLLVL